MVAGWDPEWLEFAKTMGEAPVLPEKMDGHKKQVVTNMLQYAADNLPPAPGNIVSRDFQVPDGPKVRVYRPAELDAKGEPLPLILYCHGGGWFAGNLDTEDRTCRMVCTGVHAWVVSVDYRCHFDVPLKDEIDDCFKAFEWAYGRAAEHSVDPSKYVVWGGSAGGSLAIAVVYRLVQEGKGNQVAGLVSMNGLSCHPDATPAKYRQLNTSYVDNGGDLPFISGKDTLELYRHRNIEPPNTDINVFPAAFGPDSLKGFPTTYIITSDNDASRDDGTILEAELNDIGIPVKRENVMGLAHYFWIFDLPKANANFWSKLCSGIKFTLDQR